MGIKFGCTVWTYMEPDYHAPYTEAIEKIAAAGFDGIELMVDDEKELDSYWTKDTVNEVKQLLAKHNLHLIQLCVFQNMIGGLAELQEEKQEKALANFRRVCGLAKQLGCGTVGFPAPYPEEDIRVRTTATLPEYYYLNLPDMILPGGETRSIEGWRFDAQFRMYFKEQFQWTQYWENFILNMKKINEIAEQEGIICRIENRYNTMTPHTDSVLRMLKRVDGGNIRVTLHTAQAFIQREILPWAIHKYGKHLAHVRACDGDGLACYNLPVGAGICDWEGILEALAEIGYEGYLSFEWLNDADKEENASEALAYIKRKLERVQL